MRTIITSILMIILLSGSSYAATTLETVEESIRLNVEYAGALLLGIEAAYAKGHDQAMFEAVLLELTEDETLMQCRSSNCRRTWGFRFVQGMAKERSAAKDASKGASKDSQADRGRSQWQFDKLEDRMY